MKAPKTLKTILLITLFGSMIATPVFAHGGQGMGHRAGMGYGYGGGCYYQGMGYGAGPGMGYGPGSGVGYQNAAPGWTLLTPEESTAFQIKMREVKTYDECKVVYADHRAILETRAKENNVNLMQPRVSPCDNLRANGLIR